MDLYKSLGCDKSIESFYKIEKTDISVRLLGSFFQSLIATVANNC